jgi:pre-mRNA-splicing helicase BRR2
VYKTAFESDENMLVCAPTGAGKTNIALLTMLQVIGKYINKSGKVELNKFKMVYIAPMKALVSELVGNFNSKLEPLGIKVKELTGDMQLSQ